MRLDRANGHRSGPLGHRRSRRPIGGRTVEALERRSLLASLGLGAGSQLQYVAGASIANNVAVSVAGGIYTISDTAETIAIDSILQGLGWSVDGTGHIATGPQASVFTSLAIDPNDGADTVTIGSVDVPTTIAPSATDNLTAIVGDGNTQGVLGSLAVVNPGGTTTIRVDDTSDLTGRPATLSATNAGSLVGTISGLSPASITYSPDDPVALQLLGGVGDDPLTVDFATANPIPSQGALFDGGGGSNTLNLQNGTFAEETVSAVGPGAGSLSLDGHGLTFSDLQPINDTVSATDFFFNPPVSAVGLDMQLIDGPTVNGFATDQISSNDTPATFELVNFANKTNVFIGPSDSPTLPIFFNLNAPTPAAGLASLNWSGSASNDTVNFFASPAGVATTLNGQDGDDTFSILGVLGFGAGGTDFIDGGTGTNTARIDASGQVVNASVDGQIAFSGAPTLVYARTQTITVVNAANPPLTPIPQTIFATEGVPFTNALAGAFLDADPKSIAALFSTSIDWGDLTSPIGGLVLPLSTGGFGVFGSHTYANAGTFPITVGVIDTPDTTEETFPDAVVSVSDQGGSILIHSTAVVASTTVTAQGIPVTGVEGFPLTAPVATFTIPPSESTPPTFTALIDWGDGTNPSAGTVTLNDGVYTVIGSHTYENHGTYPVTVAIETAIRPRLVATIRTTATIATDLVVRNTNDSGRGSLRYVIDAFDSLGLAGTIRFAIPGPGPFVIHTASPLSPITVPAVVDGTTQPGFAGAPIVEVDGTFAGAGDGLTLQAAGAGIRSLAIGGFTQGVGVVIQGPGNDFVENSFIGTDLTGALALPNFQGVLILGSSLNTLRGDLISGNLSAGVQILDDVNVSDPTVTFAVPPAHATANLLQGNRIGTNAAGTGPLPNQQGVFINDAAGNMLLGNVISANRSIGVQILGNQATRNLLIGNAIGTDATSTARLGNSVGVFIYAAPGNGLASNAVAFNIRAGVQFRRLADGPEIQSVAFQSDGAGNFTGAVVTFTNYLDRTRAQDPRNYSLTIPGQRFTANTPIALGQPVYNGVQRTVTLTFAQPIPAAAEVRLQINGQRPIGLTDDAGNPLDGASTLPNRAGGSNFVAFYVRGVRVNPTQPVAAAPVALAARSAARRHPSGPLSI